jgi:DNA-binding NarL/FixJ family response regulator
MLRLAVLMGAKETPKESQGEALAPDMTEREKEICTLLAEGLTNRQIAEQLYISEGTVKNYISSIYDKTGIHDRVKLIVAMKG